MKKRPIIKIDHVTKYFKLRQKELFSLQTLKHLLKKETLNNNFTAINDVSLKIYQGETIGFWGHNGSGKTTILKLISGLYKPDKGKIFVKKSIASVLELGAGLHPELTGKENIFFYSSVLNISKNQIKQNYNQIIDLFGFKDFENIPIKRYSSGMRSRLAFAIVIFSDADILLLDEALATGDVDFIEKAHSKIQSLKGKKTIIFTSPSYNTIQQLCDKMISFRNGKIVKNSDSPSMNLLRNLDDNVTLEIEVLSNSMKPLILKGDLLKIRKIAFRKLKTKDIIAFSFPNIDEIIVHRVVAKKTDKNNKKTIIYTKGDFSYETDPWTVKETNYIGKVLKIKKTKH